MFGLQNDNFCTIWGVSILSMTMMNSSAFADISTLETRSIQPIKTTPVAVKPVISSQLELASASTQVSSQQPALELTNRLVANSQIIDLASKKTLTAEGFVQQLASQDYVILGEYHDSKAQHQLAYWLLNELYQQRPQGSLLLEMLTLEQQPLVDKLAQNPPKDLKHLNESLQWQSGWDWDLYGAIVQHPIKYGYELVATNLNKSEVKALMQSAEPLSGSASTSQQIKATIKDSIMANHHLDSASDEEMAMINRMVEIQQQRDRRMAEKMLSAPTPSLLLTGNFHAQKSVGVPIHLVDLQHSQSNKKQGVVVMMVDDIDELTTDDADYAWLITDQ